MGGLRIDVTLYVSSTPQHPCFYTSALFFLVRSRMTYVEIKWIWPRSFFMDLVEYGLWHAYGWLHNHQ